MSIYSRQNLVSMTVIFHTVGHTAPKPGLERHVPQCRRWLPLHASSCFSSGNSKLLYTELILALGAEMPFCLSSLGVPLHRTTCRDGHPGSGNTRNFRVGTTLFGFHQLYFPSRLPSLSQTYNLHSFPQLLKSVKSMTAGMGQPHPSSPVPPCKAQLLDKEYAMPKDILFAHSSLLELLFGHIGIS